MHEILDFINLDEAVPLLILCALLRFVGGQIGECLPETRLRARRVAAAAFLVYGILGVAAWAPRTATEVLLIAVRSLLAAGLALGGSLIMLPVVSYVYQQTAGNLSAMNDQRSAEARRQAGAAERERALRDEREREDQRRRAGSQESADHQAREQADAAERERNATTGDARGEVMRFYDEHAGVLLDALPPALLRTQLQNRFPPGVTPEQAWVAAQEMIASMLPLIAAGLERDRLEEQTRLRNAERENRTKKEIDRLERQIERLTTSSSGEPDTVAIEVRAIRRQIQKLQDEASSFDDGDEEDQLL